MWKPTFREFEMVKEACRGCGPRHSASGKRVRLAPYGQTEARSG